MPRKIAFLALMAVLAGLPGKASAAAAAEATWDGTWTSSVARTWSAVRIYFAGDHLIGFFVNGDFLADMQSSVSDSDGVITITWTRGQAILTRDGPEAAHLLVMQKGKADTLLRLSGEPEPPATDERAATSLPSPSP